jgi:glucosamine-6-phosphate deaminase
MIPKQGIFRTKIPEVALNDNLAGSFRLVSFNYPTAAAAASDLGGIEIAKKKAAMTIGLSSITMNRNVKAIIMAAGEGKADVVKVAVEQHASVARPASALHSVRGSIFYVTHGAALKLNRSIDRRIKLIASDCYAWIKSTTLNAECIIGQPPLSYTILEEFLHNTCLEVNKSLHELELKDLANRPGASHLLSWIDEQSLREICAFASNRLKAKILCGLKSMSSIKKTYMHTAPHHDDIMLSYHGAMHYMLGRHPVPNAPMIESADSQSLQLGERYNANRNYFAYLTSGFHSVNESFLNFNLQKVLAPGFIADAHSRGDLTCSDDDLLTGFRKAFRSRDVDVMRGIESILFLRKVIEVYSLKASETICKDLAARLVELQVYQAHHQPGDAVPK